MVGQLKSSHRLTDILVKSLIALPIIWLILFIIIPILFVLKVALSQASYSVPPFTDIVTFSSNKIDINLNLGNFLAIFRDNIYFYGIANSLRLSFIASCITLLIGYPMAYFIANQQQESTQRKLIMMVLLPFWTSFVVRAYAWMIILGSDSILNKFLSHIGVISSPLKILNTEVAVVIGIVYSYLPFMVLPIYSCLEKFDTKLIEAAYDLGATPLKVFLKVILPLSASSILAGFVLVFIPGAGEFLIPELLGGSQSLMIGKLLWSEFFIGVNWPIACALTIIVITIMIIPFYILRHLSSEIAISGQR